MMCLWTGSPLQIDPLQGLLLSWSWSVYRGIICRLYRRGWGDARILVVIMGCASAVWSSLLSQLLSVCVSTYSAKLLGYPRNCNNLRVFKIFFFYNSHTAIWLIMALGTRYSLKVTIVAAVAGMVGIVSAVMGFSAERKRITVSLLPVLIPLDFKH